MNEASDFDYALIFKNETEKLNAKSLIYKACLFKDLPVDLLFYSEEEFLRKSQTGGVCWEIVHKGKIIYDKRTKI